MKNHLINDMTPEDYNIMQIQKIDDLINALKAISEKYVYYLLAIDAACFGFSVNISKDLPLTIYVIPLGIALILWGTSFCYGLMQITAFERDTKLNIKELKAPFYDVQLTSEEHLELYDSLPKKLKSYRKLQNLYFACGVVLFVIWHFIRMYNNC